jgi:hypothetical protein
MKPIDTLMKVVLLIAILLCVLTVLDYLALHDIYKDYVSKAVLISLNIVVPKELPAWTNTELEWSMVTINYIMKTLVTIINIILIVIVRNMVRKSSTKNLEQT